MAVEYLGSGNDDGVCVGRASGKLSFYGLTTAITQPSLTPVSTSAATTTLNETRIKRIQTVLDNLNLVATS